MGTNLKQYPENESGKAAFVKEVLTPLLVQTNTGWHAAEYEADCCGNEYVFLINRYGTRSKKIAVTCDSLLALVKDVLREV